MPKPCPEMAVSAPLIFDVEIAAELEISASTIVASTICVLDTEVIVASAPKPLFAIAVSGPLSLLVAIAAVLAISESTMVASVI